MISFDNDFDGLLHDQSFNDQRKVHHQSFNDHRIFDRVTTPLVTSKIQVSFSKKNLWKPIVYRSHVFW